nr:alpha/beta fold hydrolase [Agromyces bauzanensis]
MQLLDLRGTGDSQTPMDAASYRVDRQVDDLEALRSHLGLERMDLLAHSAGAALALLYAVRYGDRLRRLVLVCPTPRDDGMPHSKRRLLARRASRTPQRRPSTTRRTRSNRKR